MKKLNLTAAVNILLAVVLVFMFVASMIDTGRYQNFYLKNVIVHIPANAEDATGDAVMFMGHFDSVPMGQGASDDGVACATMLEAIRYYSEKLHFNLWLTAEYSIGK